MITIPPDFDYQGLFSDFMLFLSPFVGIEFLFTVYRYIKRAAERF